MEMNIAADRIKFSESAPGIYDPVLDIYEFGLTNNDLIEFGDVTGGLSILNNRYNYNHIALISLPSMTICPYGCDLCYNSYQCTTCQTGYQIQDSGECWIECAPGLKNQDQNTCIPDTENQLKLSQKYWDKFSRRAVFIFDDEIEDLSTLPMGKLVVNFLENTEYNSLVYEI
jgi:hypothetical protein